MTDFFGRLYEWLGLYSHDLGEFLRGWDIACTGYYTTPWYLYTGWVMIVLTGLIFALQYDLINPDRFKKPGHWSLAMLMAVIVNFILAFTVPFVAMKTGLYCLRLQISVADCMGFGLSNAFWSFVVFGLFSAFRLARKSLTR
jgi:hypothetical protein